LKNHFSFRAYGSGQPVVLIPGFAAKAGSWGFQYRWLKKYFKIITIENTGVENLGQCKGCQSINAVASEINRTLESYNITRTAILGSSMGAMIALEFAQQYPEKVSSLILASFPIGHPLSLKYIIEELDSPLHKSDGDCFFRKLLPVFFSPGFVKQDRFKIFTDLFTHDGTSFSKDVLDSQLWAMSEWLETKRWMRGCECPCLFIYGSEDQLISPEKTVKEIAKIFKKTDVKIINGAGHTVHIEKYQEFNNIVHEFFNKHPF